MPDGTAGCGLSLVRDSEPGSIHASPLSACVSFPVPVQTQETALDTHRRAASAAAQARGLREHIKAGWGS